MKERLQLNSEDYLEFESIESTVSWELVSGLHTALSVLYLFLCNHLHLLVDPSLLLLPLTLGLQHLQQLLDAVVPGAQSLLLGVDPHLELLV